MRIKVGRIASVAWGQVVVALAALAGIRVFTEILRPDQFGQAMLVIGALTFLDSVGVTALSQTLISRCGAIEDSSRRRYVAVALSRVFLLWVAPLMTLIALVISVVLSQSMRDYEWLLLPAFVLSYIVSGTLKSSALCLVVLDRRYALQSAWSAVEALLSFLGIVGALTLWRADALGYVAGYTVSALVNTILFTLVVAPGHLKLFARARAAEEVRPALSYGVPVAFMGPLGWISTYLDRYILGLVLGPAETGVYVAVTGLISRPYGLTTAVLTNYYRPLYFQPTTSELRSAQQSRILRSWLLASLTIGAVGVALSAVLGQLIANIALAPDFREGATLLMVIFAISQTFTITTHAADNAILAMQGSKRLLQTQIAVAVATVVFIPLGVSFGGLVGGLVGRCAAEGIKLAAAMGLAVRMIDNSRLSELGSKGSTEVELS